MRFRVVQNDNDRKRCVENAVLKTLHSEDVWKRGPIVLVWTGKTDALENADVIHFT